MNISEIFDIQKSTKQKILLVAIIEALYVGGRQLALWFYDYNHLTVELEYIRTALRILSALAYYFIFREFIHGLKPQVKVAHSPFVALSLLFFLVTPLLVGNVDSQDSYITGLMVFTSVFVAIKEELLIRVLVQNGLESKFGPVAAIIITSFAFAAWHTGAFGGSYFWYIQVALTSITLGCLYSVTKSFLAVVILHTVYDALFMITPVYEDVVNLYWGVIPLSISALFMVYWFFKSNVTN